jgi:formate dehydrogenase subunit gamma
MYLATIGMEGALESMTTGRVDTNWAKAHHDLWYEEEMAKRSNKAQRPGSRGATGQVAEPDAGT